MKELEKQFTGRGEVRGFNFTQLKANETGYLYAVDVEGIKHYETFKRIENTRFGCVSYPTSNAFGLWAWSNTSYESAVKRFNQLSIK